MEARSAAVVVALAAVLALAPAVHAADVALVQGFESGAEEWAAAGQWHVRSAPQSVAVSPAINPYLVTLPDAGFLPPAAEGASVAWFGQAATGTYCGTAFATVRQSPKNGCTSAARQTGRLTSPSFSLAGRSRAWIEFETWWEIEAVNADSADLMRLEVSDDGGETWSQALVLNPADPPWGGGHQQYGNDGARSSGSWQHARADISSAAGSSDVRIRFAFDTVDQRRNGFRGWLIDRVAVVDAAGDPIEGDVVTGFADPGTPVLTLRDATSQPTADGGQQVTFSVDVKPPSPKTISVDYAIEDAVPRRVADGTISFAPGATTVTETVTVGPGAAAPLRVVLANPVNAVLGGGQSGVGGSAAPGGQLVLGETAAPGEQLVLGVRQQSDTRPQLGKTVRISHVSGEIRYRLPAGRYVVLPAGETRLVPVGTVVDARRGHVSVLVENGEGRPLQQGEFWDGIFGIFQDRAARATTELRLGGGDYRACASRSRRGARRSQTRVIRRLWGKSTGRFRTKGRFASATVRGTEWNTEDLCLATRVSVRDGSVVVRDFRRRRNTVVRAGDSLTVVAAQTARYRKRTGLNRPRLARR